MVPMNDTAAHHDRPASPSAPPSPPAVDVNDVHITRGGTSILRGVTYRIEAGSCTAILGPNGCGKTTLTRAITGHMFITSGSVSVLGETIGRTDIRALRRRIAVVNPTADSASAHVSGAVVDADLTAHEAVLTGFFGTVGLYDVPSDEQRARADELLEHVGLGGRRGLRYALLSTGEQRRCLIARALVRRPELLILDEPTAGLDVAGREQVLATVDGLLHGDGRSRTTVIMITHHVEELSRHTSQVLLMRDGRFIGSGPPTDVITPESLTATFGCKVFVRRLHGRYWLEVLPEAWGEWVRTAEQKNSRTGD
jgi:iron complex transport system ATP-binding protein